MPADWGLAVRSPRSRNDPGPRGSESSQLAAALARGNVPGSVASALSGFSPIGRLVVRSHEAGVVGQPRQLVPAGDSELVEDVAHVRLERLDRYLHASGGLAIRVAPRDEVHDVTFSRRELLDTGGFDDVLIDVQEKPRNVGRYRSLPRGRGFDEVWEIRAERRLRDVPINTCLEEAENIVPLGGDREGKEADRRIGAPHLLDDVGAASTGKAHVEEDEVGFASCDHLSGVDGVVGLADDVEVLFEVVPGSGTCNVVIVDQKDPEALGHDTIPEQISTSVPRPGVLVI